MRYFSKKTMKNLVLCFLACFVIYGLVTGEYLRLLWNPLAVNFEEIYINDPCDLDDNWIKAEKEHSDLIKRWLNTLECEDLLIYGSGVTQRHGIKLETALFTYRISLADGDFDALLSITPPFGAEGEGVFTAKGGGELADKVQEIISLYRRKTQ